MKYFLAILFYAIIFYYFEDVCRTGVWSVVGVSGQLYANVEERRDKLQIYYDIVKVTARPTKITRILRLANVQYNTFLECVDRLIQAGLLETLHLSGKKPRKGRVKVVYKATEQGLEWCKNIEEIYNALRARE